MQKRAGGVLIVCAAFAILGIGGLALADSAGAAGSIAAAATIVGAASALIVRGLLGQ